MALTRTLCRHAFAVVFFVSGAAAAQAHAHLDRAVPAPGSTVQASPQQIELSFSESIEPAFSTVEVLDQKGQHVEQGKPDLGLGNAKVLRVAVKSLLPGPYKVVWRVMSVDTHRSSGSFSFAIAP